jgi:hypothetical protein
MQKITRVVFLLTNEQRATSANNHYKNAGGQKLRPAYITGHGEYGPLRRLLC